MFRLARELRRGAFHEFQAIAEGIENMSATEIVERCIGLGGKAGAFTGGDDGVEVINDQRGVSAPGRVEIGLDPNVKIYRAGEEPNTVAAGHGCGFFDFGQAENSGVEASGAFFATDGDRKLHVIEAKDGHWLQAVAPARHRPTARHRNNYRAGRTPKTSARREQIAG